MKMPVDWVFSVMLLLFCTETNHGEWLPIGIHSCLCDDQQKKVRSAAFFFAILLSMLKRWLKGSMAYFTNECRINLVLCVVGSSVCLDRHPIQPNYHHIFSFLESLFRTLQVPAPHDTQKRHFHK